MNRIVIAARRARSRCEDGELRRELIADHTVQPDCQRLLLLRAQNHLREDEVIEGVRRTRSR